MHRCVILVCITGCAVIEFTQTGGAPGDGGDDGGADGSGGAAGGPPGECPVSTECVDIPDGFDGLFSVLAGADVDCTGAPGFRGGYQTGEQAPYSALEAMCACSCVPPPDACPAAGIESFDDSTCTLSDVGLLAQPGTCTSALNATAIRIATSGPAATYACSSDGTAPTIAPVTFVEPLATCRVEGPECGPRSMCVPPASDRCIVSDADVVCPPGFPQRFDVVREESMVDTRDCQCSCQEDGSSQCGPEVGIFADDTCTRLLRETVVGACVTSADGQEIVAVRYDPFVAPCAATQLLSGSVTASTYSTFCCAEPGG